MSRVLGSASVAVCLVMLAFTAAEAQTTISTSVTYDGAIQWFSQSPGVLVVNGTRSPVLTLTNSATTSGIQGLSLGAGSGGSGAVLISAGPLGGSQMLNSGTTSLGMATGATGTATVTGAGSTWSQSGDLYIGGGVTQSGGTGSFTVAAGGTLNVVGSLLKIWDHGTLTIGSQSSVTASRFDNSVGSVVFSGGTLNIVGAFGALTATISALNGTGTISLQQATADLSLGNGSFGGAFTGAGTITFSGSGTTTLTGNSSVFTGAAYIGAGTLSVGSANNLPGAGTVTLGGGTLQATNTFTMSQQLDVTQPSTITVAPGSNFTIAQTVSGESLTVQGGGTLTLLNEFNQFGLSDPVGLTISNATVIATSGPSSPSFEMTLNNGTIEYLDSLLTTRNYTLINAGVFYVLPVTLRLQGTISGSGNLVKDGPGPLTLNGTLSYTGATSVLAGTLITHAIPNGNATVSGNGLLSLSGVASSLTLGSITNTSTLVNGGIIMSVNTVTIGSLMGTGVTSISASGTVTVGTFSGGILLANRTVHIQTMTGGIYSGSGASVDTLSGGSFTFNGTLSISSGFSSGTMAGGLALIKTGLSTDTLSLSQRLSYTGPTTVMAGTLSVAAIAGTGGITVSNGATLLVNGTTSNSLRAAVGVINNGTIVLNAAQTFSSLAGVGQLTLGGNLAASQGSYSGNLSDGGVGYTLTKNSSGTLTLSGNDNFMGGTTINAGTLVIDTGGSYTTGDVQATGSLTVANSATFTAASLLAPGELTNNGSLYANTTIASGGTLAGSGAIHGTLVQSDGSTYAPGNSPGMQTVDHNVTWGNMTYAMQIADVAGVQGVGYNSLSVTGSLNIVGTNIAVDLDSYPPNSSAAHFSNGSPFDLILASTTNGVENFVGSNFHIDSSLFEMANNLGGGSFSVILSPDGDDLLLHFAAVPEPTTLALFSLTAAAMGWRLRRNNATSEG